MTATIAQPVKSPALRVIRRDGSETEFDASTISLAMTTAFLAGINLRKEKNLFETRVTEYQSGGSVTWD